MGTILTVDKQVAIVSTVDIPTLTELTTGDRIGAWLLVKVRQHSAIFQSGAMMRELQLPDQAP